jgi:hypothetical protein
VNAGARQRTCHLDIVPRNRAAKKKAQPLWRGQALLAQRSCYLPLLLPDDFFSPPMLARLLLPLLPRARSLCASLFLLLARAPLLAAWERLLLLPEDFELRAAIDISFGKGSLAARAGAPATR